MYQIHGVHGPRNYGNTGEFFTYFWGLNWTIFWHAISASANLLLDEKKKLNLLLGGHFLVDIY